MEDIIVSTIENYNNYLDTVSNAVPKIIEKLRSEDITTLNEITNLIEGMDWIITVNTKLVEFDYVNVIPSEELVTALNEVVESIENQDYFLTADILEYDVLKLVQSCKKYSLKNS